ncbi:MAG: response regulator [Verrucomicrobiota bacterium]
MFHILVIEDNPADQKIIEKYLYNKQTVYPFDQDFKLHKAELAREALEMFVEGKFDLVLLDLSLPDIHGVDTFDKIYECMQSIPIIVLSGLENQETAVECLKRGAQDYLLKNTINSQALIRSILYASQRAAMQRQKDQARELQLKEKSFVRLRHLSEEKDVSVTAKAYGMPELHHSAPQEWEALIDRYADVLDLAIEIRAYKVEADLSESLTDLAEQIGFLKGTPRDVIRIHTAAIKRKQSFNEIKNNVYMEEGKYCLIQLLGQLVLFYRTNSLGTSNGHFA